MGKKDKWTVKRVFSKADGSFGQMCDLHVKGRLKKIELGVGENFYKFL